MMPLIKSPEIRPAGELSIEANEMLERMPSWILRRGIMLMFAVFAMMFLLAVFIKYPDTVEGETIISTSPLPIRLKAMSNGRLANLFIHENEVVSKGDYIAEIENSSGLENIRLLTKYANSVNKYLETRNYALLDQYDPKDFQAMGDGQVYYNQLFQSVREYELFVKNDIHGKQMSNMMQQVNNYGSKVKLDEGEIRLINEELHQAKERFKANERLYQEKVISKQEYFDEAALLRQKELLLEEKKSMKLQGNIAMTEYRKQMLDINNNKDERSIALRNAISEALNNVYNFIQVWQKQYLLVAPFDGNIFFLKPVQQNEIVHSTEDLFAVMPLKSQHTAYIYLPAEGLGKVEKGQSVQLMISQFPFNEYGYLEGQVNAISALPQSTADGSATKVGYQVVVHLPDSLVTTHHVVIPFKSEMSGTGRIITKDKNIFERLVMSAHSAVM